MRYYTVGRNTPVLRETVLADIVGVILEIQSEYQGYWKIPLPASQGISIIRGMTQKRERELKFIHSLTRPLSTCYSEVPYFHIYTYIILFVYMCVYTHTHTYIYIHTHIYIPPPNSLHAPGNHNWFVSPRLEKKQKQRQTLQKSCKLSVSPHHWNCHAPKWVWIFLELLCALTLWPASGVGKLCLMVWSGTTGDRGEMRGVDLWACHTCPTTQWV